MDEGPRQEGRVEFLVDSINTPSQTYYKIFGDLRSGPPPVVVLHGGPGSGHEYCLPFRKLWSLYGIPVVFYDQIGCAASTHFREKVGDRSFWTIDLFVAELENLLGHLHLSDQDDDGPGFHVLGHSWGGVVATAFAARRPRRLRKLVLIGTPADGEVFFQDFWRLKKQLSPESQQAIDEAVRKHEFTSPAYLAAMNEWCRTFLCRSSPWPPEELALDFKNQTDDATVRRSIIGPSAWEPEGLLKEWSSIPLCPQITAPTLVMNGEYDTAQYEPTVPFFNHIPRVRWVTIAGGSHMFHLDSPELQQKAMRLIGEFLR